MSGSIIRTKAKKFSSFAEMMIWAENYYETHENLWGQDGMIFCVSYDIKGDDFILRGISEWDETIISRVEFAGEFVAGFGDREHIGA